MPNKRLTFVCSPQAKALHRSFTFVLLVVALTTLSTLPIQAENIAPRGATSPDASAKAWFALPHFGLNHRVRALAVAGNDLYVSGRFTQTQDKSVTDLNRIVRYDTMANTWNALSNRGLSDEVTALEVMGSDLYAGGWFTQTVDGAVPNLGNIAHYDTATGVWSALPKKGLNGHVFALTAVGDDLYTGGTFSQTGDGSVSNLNGIARYDTTTGTWHALPNQGLNGNVYMLATAGSDVYVGGNFGKTDDGTVSGLSSIARYDTVTGTWHALPNQGLNENVHALTVSGNDVYVGGYFTQTADGAVTNLSRIARYNTMTGTWHALSNQGLDNGVFALTVMGDGLYAGGSFGQTSDGSVINLGCIVRYDTVAGTWHALPNQGLSNWVYAFAAVDDNLYVGGEFNQTSDMLVPGVSHIARLVGSAYRVYLPLVSKQ